MLYGSIEQNKRIE